MSRADAETDDLVKKMRTSLAAAHGHPSAFRIQLRKARADFANWVPRLMKLAGEEGDKSPETAGELLLRLVSTTEDLDKLLGVYRALPRRTTQLAEVAVCVTERLLARFPKEERLRGWEAAMLWNNLSVRCRENDQPDLALRAAEVAVQIATSCPGDAHAQRVLVRCLLTGAREWAADGQHPRALAAADHACSVVERLRQAGNLEDAELEVLAGANRANRLSALGRQEEAIGCAQAVRVKILAHLPHPELEQTLAFVEMTLASCLNAAGRHEEALPHGEAADRLFRTQSEESPGERLEYTAAAANAYADALIGTGKAEAARRVLIQAIRRIETFVRRWHGRFGRDLSILRMNLADAERSLGHPEEAVRRGGQALADIQAYGRQTRRRDWHAEGTAANILFLALYQLGRQREAEKVVRRAFHCFRRLPDTHPEARPERARTLRYLAEVHLPSGKRGAAQRAAAFARRALDLALQTSGSTPAGMLLVAQCHSTLGLCLETLGRVAEALKEARTALGICRILHERSAVPYRADLAHSLYRLSRLLVKSGDYAAAKALALEAISLYEQVVRGDGEGRVRFLADSLRNLAESQLALKEVQQAVASYERAILVLRPEYEAATRIWLPTLVPLCIRYVQVGETFGVPYRMGLVEDVLRRAREERAGG